MYGAESACSPSAHARDEPVQQLLLDRAGGPGVGWTRDPGPGEGLGALSGLAVLPDRTLAADQD